MNRAVPCLAALALLGIMFARMLHAATLLSPVVDEQSHISRGLSVLRTGDLRLRIGHPIGLNVWEALPLALDPTVDLPLDHESWANAAWDRFGEQFLWHINANPDGIVLRSRVMVMLLTLVLGALVFRWADELYGPRAGVLALALYSLDPNLLAHGMLATTDLGVTLFVFAATYALWRAVRVRQRRWLIAAGTLAGLALISKYSALLLIPTFAVLVGSLVIGHSLLVIGHWSLVIRHSSFVIIPALLTVAALYLFRLDLYLAEFSYLLAETQTHPSFLLGQRSIEGWWYYFLVTFFLKTPLPTLLFVAWAVMLGVARMRGRRGGATEVATTVGGATEVATTVGGLKVVNAVGGSGFLLIPSLLYFGSSVLSGFNVGYRHLLPVLPFLLVYSSGVARIQHPRSTHIRFSSLIPHPSSLIAALVLWLALSSFASHPDYIAYFNEAAPSPRHDVLVDSNLDWGQSLKQLRSYLDANAIDRVKLSYFGAADPAAYGIDYDPLPRWPPPRQVDFVPANPAPGVYAISASNLQGILLDDPGVFDWFHRRDPDAVVGHTILVYHVAAEPKPPQAVGLCREPWTPVDDDEVDALFGRQGLRVVRFDCVNSWWWPDAPVWYVVPPEVDPGPIGALVYERRRGDDSIVYRVLRGQGAAVAHHPLDTPARFAGGLTLLGFDGLPERQAGRAFAVESVWRVDAPLTPPVSIFAHVLDANGAFVAGADGFGVPAELLQPGDVIAQRHRFEIPSDAPNGVYTLSFGFYRLDTLERYAILVDGEPVDQRVWIGPFSITE